MRDVLICTVGTSLLSNLSRAGEGLLERLCGERNSKGLAVELAKGDPAQRVCGAEVNSVCSILRQNLANPEVLYLLVSDTEAGTYTGEILKHYFSTGSSPLHFREVHVERIVGMTDADVIRFEREGLRNLVRNIGAAVRKYGPERILINATGGYKAQISFAGMIGQALEIPVCYLFESFPKVIRLPPQPISFDLSLWLDHCDLFYDLEAGLESSGPFESSDPRFASLVEEIQEGNEYLVMLSPAGQLFHEMFRLRFEQRRELLLPPATDIPPAKKTVRYEDDNENKHRGLKYYLKNLLEVPYVKQIYLFYSHPALERPNRFKASSRGVPSQVEGWFSSGGALSKFDVVTTAADLQQLKACVADLNQRFCE